ncbi:MAG: carboxypeptidase-like regulatory domain-containing protein [Emticicia sp.]|uniref:carboxypeptidase-like regulatory domain-containing protein n=1 Tax=Emticicia sp. TaxID=1930953 RepID=UPI003BA791F9
MTFKCIIKYIIYLCFPLLSFAQRNIEGRVISGEDRKPLSFANVFISNSTKGQQADDKGRFKLTNVPAGVLDLVVSFVGYETISIKVKADTLRKPLLIMLSPDAIALQGVTVKRLKNGFERYYPLFKEHFLGKTLFSESCVLKNPKALWFSLSDDESELTINADEPLEIENRALGYTIKYDLEEFKYSFSQNYVTYYGFPFFQEMTTKNEKKQQKWHENREKAYFGSPQHFLKSAINHDWANAGYKVYTMYREEKRFFLVPLFPEIKDSLGNIIQHAAKAKKEVDSTDIILSKNSWLHKIPNLKRSPYVQYLHKLPLDENCIFEVRENLPLLNFENYLYVFYEREFEEPQFADLGKKDAPQVSILTLLEPKTLIESTGHLVNPLAVLFEGRWGIEKMGEFLPIDYEPESF